MGIIVVKGNFIKNIDELSEEEKRILENINEIIDNEKTQIEKLKEIEQVKIVEIEPNNIKKNTNYYNEEWKNNNMNDKKYSKINSNYKYISYQKIKKFH